jgi:hypothetical protein
MAFISQIIQLQRKYGYKNYSCLIDHFLNPTTHKKTFKTRQDNNRLSTKTKTKRKSRNITEKSYK